MAYGSSLGLEQALHRERVTKLNTLTNKTFMKSHVTYRIAALVDQIRYDDTAFRIALAAATERMRAFTRGIDRKRHRGRSRSEGN